MTLLCSSAHASRTGRESYLSACTCGIPGVGMTPTPPPCLEDPFSSFFPKSSQEGFRDQGWKSSPAKYTSPLLSCYFSINVSPLACPRQHPSSFPGNLTLQVFLSALIIKTPLSEISYHLALLLHCPPSFLPDITLALFSFIANFQHSAPCTCNLQLLFSLLRLKPFPG